MPTYQELFSRNLGVLLPAEQDRLRRARALVVGCGGLGGTVALALARSGVGGLVLVDPDRFEASNLNRQMAATTATIGRPKAAVLAEMVRQVNPELDVVAHERVLSLAEVGELARGVDLVLPAADDLAYSVRTFGVARAAGKTALYVIPSGLWAMVSVLRPDGPTIEELCGLPTGVDDAALKEAFEAPLYRLSTSFYKKVGGWQPAWHRDFVEGRAPLAQVAPMVWLASSLGALEAVLHLTGRPCTAAPRFWWVTPQRVARQTFPGPNRHTLLVAQRRAAWRALRGPGGALVGRAILKAWRRMG